MNFRILYPYPSKSEEEQYFYVNSGITSYFILFNYLAVFLCFIAYLNFVVKNILS